MRLLKHTRYANADDDLVIFVHDGRSVPGAASGWTETDLYLDHLTIKDVMNRRIAEKVFVYEHERLQIFILRAEPEVTFEGYKCRGKSAYLFLRDWEGFRRFLRQGK